MNRLSTAKRTFAASAIGIAALAATIALAQPTGYGPGPGYGPQPQTTGSTVDWAQGRLDRMAWRLNLTNEQKAKLKLVFVNKMRTSKAWRNMPDREPFRIFSLCNADIVTCSQMLVEKKFEVYI